MSTNTLTDMMLSGQISVTVSASAIVKPHAAASASLAPLE
jgi:hypothetical protein